MVLRQGGKWKTDFPNAKVLVVALKTEDAFLIRGGDGMAERLTGPRFPNVRARSYAKRGCDVRLSLDRDWITDMVMGPLWAKKEQFKRRQYYSSTATQVCLRRVRCEDKK
jgi:hypothetical protein